jgi:hypothetical protein
MSGSRRKSGPLGPFVDGYRAWLLERGYSPSVAIRSLITLGHLGRWMEREEFAVDQLFRSSQTSPVPSIGGRYMAAPAARRRPRSDDRLDARTRHKAGLPSERFTSLLLATSRSGPASSTAPSRDLHSRISSGLKVAMGRRSRLCLGHTEDPSSSRREAPRTAKQLSRELDLTGWSCPLPSHLAIYLTRLRTLHPSLLLADLSPLGHVFVKLGIVRRPRVCAAFPIRLAASAHPGLRPGLPLGWQDRWAVFFAVCECAPV